MAIKETLWSIITILSQLNETEKDQFDHQYISKVLFADSDFTANVI